MTRGRKPLITPTRSLHIHIEEPLAKLIDERLYSEAEQRVPKGAYQEFFTEASVKLLRLRPLDLSPYIGSIPMEHIVFAFEGSIEALKSLLERQSHVSDFTRDAEQDRPLARTSDRRGADGSGAGGGDQGTAG